MRIWREMDGLLISNYCNVINVKTGHKFKLNAGTKNITYHAPTISLGKNKGQANFFDLTIKAFPEHREVLLKIKTGINQNNIYSFVDDANNNNIKLF